MTNKKTRNMIEDLSKMPKKTKRERKGRSSYWRNHRIQTLNSTSCIIYPVDAATNSAWAESFSPRVKKKILRKRRCAILRTPVMCLQGVVLPESGWIFYTFFKVHRHFCVLSCIPTSVCQCHCPRRDVAWTVRMVTGVPWRAAVCRPSPGGTVTQNASSVRGRQITTTHYCRCCRDRRGVAALWRLEEERRGEESAH